MTTEQDKAVARRLYEAIETNDRAALDEVLAPEVVVHNPNPVNREAMLQGLEMFYMAFSELHNTIEDLVAEGDKVAVRTNLQATHTGDFQGLPPTGKRISIGGITIERIRDGKIVERWVNIDYLGMMQQLGLVPPPQADR